jgi:hypothetical protein
MLFGPAAGRERLTLSMKGAGTAYSVAFSPDSTKIAAASARAGITLWNLDEVKGTPGTPADEGR